MSRHGMDRELGNATEEHLHSLPADEASRAQQWLEHGSLLGAVLKRLLPRSQGSRQPRSDSRSGASGTPAE